MCLNCHWIIQRETLSTSEDFCPLFFHANSQDKNLLIDSVFYVSYTLMSAVIKRGCNFSGFCMFYDIRMQMKQTLLEMLSK